MLADFLNISRGDVVSFVGGGGKTTLMMMLARELAGEHKVVVTTTTRMGGDEIEGFKVYRDIATLEQELRMGKPVALFGDLQDRKVLGVPMGVQEASPDGHQTHGTGHSLIHHQGRCGVRIRRYGHAAG